MKFSLGHTLISRIIALFIINYFDDRLVFFFSNDSLQPLNGEDLLLYFILCDSKKNIFGKTGHLKTCLSVLSNHDSHFSYILRIPAPE